MGGWVSVVFGFLGFKIVRFLRKSKIWLGMVKQGVLRSIVKKAFELYDAGK